MLQQLGKIGSYWAETGQTNKGRMGGENHDKLEGRNGQQSILEIIAHQLDDCKVVWGGGIKITDCLASALCMLGCSEKSAKYHAH